MLPTSISEGRAENRRQLRDSLDNMLRCRMPWLRILPLLLTSFISKERSWSPHRSQKAFQIGDESESTRIDMVAMTWVSGS